MGNESLGVDVDALRSMAKALRGEADRIAEIDPVGPIDAAAGAMPASAIGAAAARAGVPLLKAYRDTAERLRDMSAYADSNSRDYDTADQNFRRQLDAKAGEI